MLLMFSVFYRVLYVPLAVCQSSIWTDLLHACHACLLFSLEAAVLRVLCVLPDILATKLGCLLVIFAQLARMDRSLGKQVVAAA